MCNIKKGDHRLRHHRIIQSESIFTQKRRVVAHPPHKPRLLRYESKMGPKAGIPLASRSKTNFCVKTGLLTTATASASNSRTRFITKGNISTRLAMRLVSRTTGSLSISATKSRMSWPYVFNGVRVCHRTRMAGRFLSPRKLRHGPMPDPVVTTMMRRNMRMT